MNRQAANVTNCQTGERTRQSLPNFVKLYDQSGS